MLAKPAPLPGEAFGHRQIVGVVANAQYSSLEEAAEELVYWPATVGTADDPEPTRSMQVVMKTSSDPAGFVAMLRREVQAINGRIPVSEPRTMDDLMETATARTSFTMSLLGVASAIALLLGLAVSTRVAWVAPVNRR